MVGLEDALNNLKETMIAENISPEDGMPEELFLFSTTLSPVVNVDLLVTNEKHQVLLIWREDAHNGSGWHVPGGCIRFRETINERISACARSELNTEVTYDLEPIAIVEHLINFPRNIEDQNERAHFVTLSYRCLVPPGFEPSEKMRWFDELPSNLLRTQNSYRKQWSEISKKL